MRHLTFVLFPTRVEAGDVKPRAVNQSLYGLGCLRYLKNVGGVWKNTGVRGLWVFVRRLSVGFAGVRLRGRGVYLATSGLHGRWMSRRIWKRH